MSYATGTEESASVNRKTQGTAKTHAGSNIQQVLGFSLFDSYDKYTQLSFQENVPKWQKFCAGPTANQHI